MRLRYLSHTEVSIHAPTRGATEDTGHTYHKGLVSIHAPTRGATDFFQISLLPNMFQSTHPRGVRQTSFLIPDLLTTVSIHAPTRGATSKSVTSNLKPEAVSIHAPTRGATYLCLGLTSAAIMFQSTHPRGVRPGPPLYAFGGTPFQSTHPRGVRLLSLSW